MPFGGLRLIPPESKVSPLPTSSRVGFLGAVLYWRITIFGGWAEPLLTPRMPPIFSRCMSVFDSTLQVKPWIFASLRPKSANRAGVQTLPGSFAMSRALQPAVAATRPRFNPATTVFAAFATKSTTSLISPWGSSSSLLLVLYFLNW